ncbi:hypothetical protein FDP41_009900 [Naegleria fowleri]|uniref:NOT2/NOT3/NOT5 C-terminal domain-containing protein n=1 Tax=Naegleria fowleri TaxID=5763 RepID=A0A6A5AYG3_NAEFO|nr:uncharacterized protein FDP41_009900 [Naegleria fowleri]KAF0971677.1 hypothetical protein FDP41_009900 [Naegleria fowleri]CAG4718036.1 unnamed protein product [Naegleria fowleri]
MKQQFMGVAVNPSSISSSSSSSHTGSIIGSSSSGGVATGNYLSALTQNSPMLGGKNPLVLNGSSNTNINSTSSGALGNVNTIIGSSRNLNQHQTMGGFMNQTSSGVGGLMDGNFNQRGMGGMTPSSATSIRGGGLPSSSSGLMNQPGSVNRISPTQQLINRSTTPSSSLNQNTTLASSGVSGDSYRPSESILSMINSGQQFAGQFPSSAMKLPQISQNNIFKNIALSNYTPQQKQSMIIQVRNLAQQNGFDANTIDQHFQEYLMYEQTRQYQLHLLQQQQQMQQRQVTADDKYSLFGLTSIFKAKDSDLAVLALGLDLTSLGLNLNATEQIYHQFASPFSDIQPPGIIPDYRVPDCYKLHMPLHEFHIEKFTDETLLYMFYAMPRDVLQLVAARELTKRGWKYHKPTQLWFIRDVSVNDFVQTPDGEKGTYFYFDVQSWSRKRKAGVILSYDMLYNPAPFLQQQQQKQ